MIKVCDVKNIPEIKTLSLLGINFLGFHLITENDWKRRHIIKTGVRYISDYSSSKSILVTKETDFSTLTKVIREFEFDGVQLHYKNNSAIISKIRTEFGNDFIIIDVKEACEDDIAVNPKADYLLLDSSYTGGTGKRVTQALLKSIIGKIELKNTFIAGGITAENIKEIIDLGFINFDIQTGVKKLPENKTYNTEYRKVNEFMSVIKTKSDVKLDGQIYASIKSRDEFYEYYDLVDALHFDISDSFVGDVSDIDSLGNLFKEIHEFNSMIPIQLHFFAKKIESIRDIIERIGLDFSEHPYSVFVHINKDNYREIGKHEFLSAIDVSDTLDDDFPLDYIITKRLLVCLQSELNPKRITNLNTALKYIRLTNDNMKEIIIDRGVDSDVALGLASTSKLSLVVGRHLKDGETLNKIKLLKSLLYAKK